MQPSAVERREIPRSDRYLVIKYHQPDRGYDPLEHEGEREILVELPGLVVERWKFAPGEAYRVSARPHVARVVEEGVAAVPPPPLLRHEPAQRRRLTLTDAMELHRIPAAHAAGILGKGRRMAILDTGCAEWLAEALGARLVAAESMVPNEDWRDTGAESGHGTFCCHVPAEACPEAEIVSIKVLSSQEGWGRASWIIAGIRRAMQLGCTSIGMSLGGPGDPTDAMSRMVDEAARQGLFVAAAAGNEQQGSNRYEADFSHPACAAGAFATAAVDSDLVLAPFSNHGVCLDGSGIGVWIEEGPPGEPARLWSGTSMATPLVHAVAGLAGSVPGATPDSVRQAVEASCRDSEYESWKEGHGFVDAYAAIEKLGGIAPPAPIDAPPPEDDDDYLPDLPRRSLSRLRTDYYEHVVGTYRRRPVGEWTPREESR